MLYPLPQPSCSGWLLKNRRRMLLEECGRTRNGNMGRVLYKSSSSSTSWITSRDPFRPFLFFLGRGTLISWSSSPGRYLWANENGVADTETCLCLFKALAREFENPITLLSALPSMTYRFIAVMTSVSSILLLPLWLANTSRSPLNCSKN